jgi:hypothetical protein
MTMKRKLSLLLLPLLIAFGGFGATAASGAGSSSSAASEHGPDDARSCSELLAKHADNSLPVELNERCVQAIATTYINGEENSIKPEDILFADGVSRHQLGTPPNFQHGNAAALVLGYHNGSTAVILSIKDRHWVVEGNDAWINYTGFLKCNPNTPGFYVGERITVTRGLIHEILIAGVVIPPGVCPKR